MWLFSSVQRRCAGPFERERLVAEYWYLCRRAARRFMRRGLDRADLEQVGAIGLIKAVDRYDPLAARPVRGLRVAPDRRRADALRSRQRTLRARATGVCASSIGDGRAAERELALAARSRAVRGDVAQFIARDAVASARNPRLSREQVTSSRSKCWARARAVRLPGGIDELLDRLTVERILEALSPLQKRRSSRRFISTASRVVELAARLGYSRRHVTRLHRAAFERLKCSH